MTQIQTDISLKPFVTLKAGGSADQFLCARNLDDLRDAALGAQLDRLPTTVIGFGSNILPSDDGVRGLTVLNRADKIQIGDDGEVVAQTGCSFQDLFLKTIQAGLKGLEFAVGIPGTLGGALVSNAGAYRSCVSEFLIELEVAYEGSVLWVDPSWMEFSYRDSRLRQPDAPQAVVLQVKMRLPKGDAKKSYDEAREYQRQRIGKQPPSPSAGSFFKNVNDQLLADSLMSLPLPLKQAGVVPAGYLIEAAGLKGYRYGGAMMGLRHANFMLNVGNASAYEIYRLAMLVKDHVYNQFGVRLEEEVMYIGDWHRFSA